MDLIPWMERWHMFPEPGGIVLCAVSGGRDSVCLLDYLHALTLQRDFRVAAAHLNHGMRPTAGRDESLVRRLCEERDIPLYVGYEKVYERAREWNLGAEETGRRLRYEFLARTADEIGASRIATAHHMGDQAETVLLNLLRGTGTDGLGGIPPVRGRLIRPLLNTPRGEVEAYVAEHGLPYVEDETNTDLHYARNRLRLVIWPELERINGAARENVARAAAIVRQESAYLDELAAARLPAEGTRVSCGQLLDAPEALRPRMLRLLVDRLGCGKKDFGQSHLTALEQLARTGGMLSLPGGARALCRDGLLTLEMAPQTGPDEVELTEGSPVCWGPWELCLHTGKAEPGALCLRGAGPWTVRSWRSGDRLTLPGSRGGRSLKRLFAEAGIPPEHREEIPVLCSGGQAAAVPGIGTDRAFTEEENGGDPAVMIAMKKREEKEHGAQ